MARTDLTPYALLSGKNAYPKQVLTQAAADIVNQNAIPHTGKEIILAKNSSGGALTVTITSIADSVQGRTGDITAASLAASELALFGPYPVDGWRQADNRLYLQASGVGILFTVLRLP